MSTYKLHYFNVRGRAEVSRLIFAAAGQRFQDIRYEQADWPSQKSKMPLGQMPLLEFDTVKIPQSSSIARFLAKQFHLNGRNNVEQAKVEAVADTINDAISVIMPIRREQDETKKQELMRKYFSDDLPKHLQSFEILAKLYGNGGHYFVGSHLSWADLLFYDFGETLLSIDAHCLDNSPWLKQNRVDVEKNPNIAAYLRQRPKTAF